MQRSRGGFSLLEVGVVIVIVGVVAGAILTTQELSRRSEMRSIVADATAYAMAKQEFQAKYRALPGDIPNATSYWGGLPTGACIPGGSTSEALTSGRATCDGNGNGVIDESAACEHYRAWQHLASGEFVAGTYGGHSGKPNCTPNSQIGVNVPASKMAESGFSMINRGVKAEDAVYFDGDYNDAMIFGKAALYTFTEGPALKAKEAREIDEKFDDVSPATGSIRSVRSGVEPTPRCVGDDAAGNTAIYNERHKTPACSLIFMNTFKRKSAY